MDTDNLQDQQPEQQQPEQQQPEQQQPTLVTLGIIIDCMGDLLPHGNGERWHRLLVSGEMAAALYNQLAPMFPPNNQ